MLAYVIVSICCRKLGRALVHSLPFSLQGLPELSNVLGKTDGVGVVSVEVLNLAAKSGVVLLSKSPVVGTHYFSESSGQRRST